MMYVNIYAVYYFKPFALIIEYSQTVFGWFSLPKSITEAKCVSLTFFDL